VLPLGITASLVVSSFRQLISISKLCGSVALIHSLLPLPMIVA
jgi:hypothetical protein